MDAVARTASAVGVSVRFIFQRAIETQNHTNEEEVLKYRLARYMSYGEIPPYVEEYAKNLLETIQSIQFS